MESDVICASRRRVISMVDRRTQFCIQARISGRVGVAPGAAVIDRGEIVENGAAVNGSIDVYFVHLAIRAAGTLNRDVLACLRSSTCRHSRRSADVARTVVLVNEYVPITR